MRQKVGIHLGGDLVNQAVFADAIIARLVMLQAEAGNVIAQRI